MELARLHTRRVAPIDQTLQGGTQTAAGLFDRDVREIRLLRDAVQEAVADYIKSLPADAQHPFLSRRDSEFHFSGSWSCRLASGGFHTNHIHEEGWISSAYYAALPDDLGAGSGGALKFGESRFPLGAEDRPSHMVQPQVGKLVLFPSYYWHGTRHFTPNSPAWRSLSTSCPVAVNCGSRAQADFNVFTWPSITEASTVIGTAPAFTTVSLKSRRSNFAPSVALALSRRRMISEWPIL